MPTPAQQQSITSAIAQIKAAEDALQTAINNTGDPDALNALQQQYQVLNTRNNLLLQAQVAADDATYTTITTTLKTEAATVQAQEAKIKQLIADVATAAKIIGYIAQAASLIAKL
jgi:predicted  nucleic acid-binding Zn-ribbon protein